jgi:hypothetical protein
MQATITSQPYPGEFRHRSSRHRHQPRFHRKNPFMEIRHGDRD